MNLNEVLDRITGMDLEAKQVLLEKTVASMGGRKFTPSPGPQTDAWFSKADVLLYGGEAGGGKEQDVDSKVLTPWGWKRIGDLRVGSRICAVDGTVTEVIAVFPQGVKDIYRVVMVDGGETTAGLDHRWLAWDTSKSRKIGNEVTGGQSAARKYTTAQLIEAMARDCGKGNGRRVRFALPVTEPVALNVAGGCVGSGNFVGREVDPYLLGLLLGDGCIRAKKAEITTCDDETVEWVKNYAGDDVRVTYGEDGNYTLALRGDLLAATKMALGRMGVDGKGSWEKSIPRQYLWGPVEDRWSILQGLMDTDGWAEPKRAIYFTSVSRDLCDGVAHLAQSLGGIVSWSEKSPTYTGSGGEKLEGRTAWCLRIKLPEPEKAFRLTRKRHIAAKIRHQSHGRIIESIEFSHRAEAVCIQVAHPSSLYVTDDFIVTHNSGLLCGLALECHHQSLLMRRNGTDLEGGGGLIEDLLRIHGSRDGFSGKSPPTLRTSGGRIITFGSAKDVGDEMKYQGRARDFLGIDEATQFAEVQVRFLMGWVRTVKEGQRTRSVLATNPPVTSDGDWIIGMFRPWLDLTHPNPAKPGELRYFITVSDGYTSKDLEVDGPEPVQRDGDVFIPTSRTFIPARLSDNPFIQTEDYQKQLDALPEPYRSAIRDGNFMAGRKDDDFQVIPTQWIREAQARWVPTPPKHAPMSALAVDVAQGGADNSIFQARYDGWFAMPKVVPGAETPTGNEVAGLAIAERRNGATIIIDMGGGYGGAAYMRLKDNEIDPLVGHKGAESSVRRSADNQFGFYNKRAEIAWKLREALDPAQDGGSDIALPDDPIMVSDLTAMRFTITSSGIKVTPKEEMVRTLGRSPDRGDAVMMANAYGPRLMTHGNEWRRYSDATRSTSGPKVVMSHMAARRKR